jgi:hypothetical protein
MGETIDHHFFVEDSDHRHILNDNLVTLLDPDHLTWCDFVPARARQMNKNGDSMIATDILAGSMVGRDQIPTIPPRGDVWKSDGKSSDLIQFDWLQYAFAGLLVRYLSFPLIRHQYIHNKLRVT